MARRKREVLVVNKEYKLTPHERGLQLEALDYHVRPRLVPWSELERIGVSQSPHRLEVRSRGQRTKATIDAALSQLITVIASLDEKIASARQEVDDLRDVWDELGEQAGFTGLDIGTVRRELVERNVFSESFTDQLIEGLGKAGLKETNGVTRSDGYPY